MEAGGRSTGKCPRHQQTTPVCLTAIKTIITTINNGTQATPGPYSTTRSYTLLRKKTHRDITTNKAQNLSAFIKGAIHGIQPNSRVLVQTLLPIRPSSAALEMEVLLPAVHVLLQVPLHTQWAVAEKIHHSFISVALNSVDSRNSKEAPITPRDLARHPPRPTTPKMVQKPGCQTSNIERLRSPSVHDSPLTAGQEQTRLRRSLKNTKKRRSR